ncbi:unnamed protein product [Phytomonas sp. EM1]|nr:unnamed protein product [Phytomonas sp. EM1]|eukprot:CCW60222.1 unnamed protein product [Phytomonas sp. isolate EM1]
MTSVEAPLKLSREEVHAYVGAFLHDLRTSNSVLAAAKRQCEEHPAKRTEDELIDLYEAVQAEFFMNLPACAKSDGGKEIEEHNDPEKGAAIVRALHTAVEDYPDDETEALITKMCVAIESHIRFLEHATSAPGDAPSFPTSSSSLSFPPAFAEAEGSRTMQENINRMLAKMNAGIPPSEDDIRDAAAIWAQMASYMQSSNNPHGSGQVPGMQ